MLSTIFEFLGSNFLGSSSFIVPVLLVVIALILFFK